MPPTKSASDVNRETFAPRLLEATGEAARALLDEVGDRGAELVAAWIACKNIDAVAEVAADDDAPTPARKAARRGLNVLKSRGMAVPDRPRKAPSVVASAEIYEAWFRAPDGAGTSAFTLGARSEPGRYRLVDVIIKAGTGLVSIAGMQMSRTQVRESFDAIEKRFGVAPAVVPIGWARARIAAARAENQRAKTPVPLGFETHRDLLGPAPSEAPPHPARTKLAAVDRAAALATSAKLHAEPELRAWLPEPPAMQRMLLAVRASMPSGGGADREAAEAKVRAVIEQATDQYFSRELCSGIATRLEDVAISVLARGASDRASEILALSDVLRSSNEVASPHTVPFLRAYFEKAFGLLTARMAERG